jgi:hypothetical protein
MRNIDFSSRQVYVGLGRVPDINSEAGRWTEVVQNDP